MGLRFGQLLGKDREGGRDCEYMNRNVAALPSSEDLLGLNSYPFILL